MYPVHRSGSSFYSSYSGPPSSPVESVASSSEPQDMPSEPEALSASISFTDSQSVSEWSLARPLWDISWNASRIVVDRHSFKLAEGRRGFIDLLKHLNISLTFYFKLKEREYEPDDSYEDNPTRPMPFDLLPLLEYHRKLMNDGKSTQGAEALINWLIRHYLPPNEPILFAMYDTKGNKIETKKLSIGALMLIYGFAEKKAGDHEAYRSLSPESRVCVHLESWEWEDPKRPLCAELQADTLPLSWMNDCKGTDDFLPSFQPNELEHVESQLIHWIEQWAITQNPQALNELASLVTIADYLLPNCPPDQGSSLSSWTTTANEILLHADPEAYCLQPMEPKEEEPPPSPESDRRRRREEKEKAI